MFYSAIQAKGNTFKKKKELNTKRSKKKKQTPNTPNINLPRQVDYEPIQPNFLILHHGLSVNWDLALRQMKDVRWISRTSLIV